MKVRLIITFVTLICSLFLGPLQSALVFAATASPSPQATPAAAVDQKTQDLLNRVTDKVAQLSGQLRRTYHGKIKSLGTNSFIVSTEGGDRTITTNDVTNFFRIRGGNEAEVNFNALKVSDDISAIGTIDPQTGDMTAKQVVAKIQRFSIVGTISQIDKTVYTITKTDTTTVKVDLGDALTLKKVANGKIVAAKIADFQTGSVIVVVAYFPDPNFTTLSALKALILPKI